MTVREAARAIAKKILDGERSATVINLAVHLAVNALGTTPPEVWRAVREALGEKEGLLEELA